MMPKYMLPSAKEVVPATQTTTPGFTPELLQAASRYQTARGNSDGIKDNALKYFQALTKQPKTNEKQLQGEEQVLIDLIDNKETDKRLITSQIKKTHQHLAEMSKIMLDSVKSSPMCPAPSSEADNYSKINKAFKDSCPPFKGSKWRFTQDNIVFSFEHGVKAAIEFYERNSIHGIVESKRLAIMNQPAHLFYIIPLRIIPFALGRVDAHYNDAYWMGFMETAFYVGGSKPKISLNLAGGVQSQLMEQDGTGYKNASSNMIIRHQLRILATMDEVKKSGELTDCYDRAEIINKCFDKLLANSSLAQHTPKHIMYHGHSPLTTMLRMIQKNHYLLSEILKRKDPSFNKLKDALCRLPHSRVTLSFQKGNEFPLAKINYRWYEKIGLWYISTHKTMSDFHLQCKNKMGKSLTGLIYIVPWLILSLVLALIPDPKILKDEGRLNAFGYGKRGAQRTQVSSQAIANQLKSGNAYDLKQLQDYLWNKMENPDDRNRILEATTLK